jgi:hypothetical protein
MNRGLFLNEVGSIEEIENGKKFPQARKWGET